MPVKIQPTSEIIANLGLEPNGRIQKFFTDTCYKAMTKYVPMSDTIHKGDLRRAVVERNYIIYMMPYARYQYYGVREDGTHKVRHYTTPGTGTYWDRKMWSAEKDIVIKQVQNEINRGGI